jgi:hypothetical protein
LIQYQEDVDVRNVLTAAELKRRGMAAIEEHLEHGPVHIIKRNRPAAVVLSEADYQRLVGDRSDVGPGLSALQWLLAQPAGGTRTPASIQRSLDAERDW